MVIEAAVQLALQKQSAEIAAFEKKIDAAHSAAKDELRKYMTGKPSLMIKSVSCHHNAISVNFDHRAFVNSPAIKRLRKLENNQPSRYRGAHQIRERVKRQITQQEVATLLSNPIVAAQILKLTQTKA